MALYKCIIIIIIITRLNPSQELRGATQTGRHRLLDLPTTEIWNLDWVDLGQLSLPSLRGW